MKAWGAFLRAHADLVPRMDRLLRKRAGVALRDYDVLAQVDLAGGACTMRELDRRVLLSQSGLSRLVQRLADEGFVGRATNEGDRRGVDLRLTAQGRSVLRRARKVQAEEVRTLFADQMSPEEARTVLRVMRRLSEHADPS
jgi:DNA-binding MarR family transcriptional regulator